MDMSKISPRPRVVVAIKIYDVVGLVLAIVLLVFGLRAFPASEEARAALDDDAVPLLVLGVVLTTFGALIAPAFAVGLLAPRRRWSWYLHIGLIGVGLLQIITLPVSVPLLMFWLRDGTREYFDALPAADS